MKQKLFVELVIKKKLEMLAIQERNLVPKLSRLRKIVGMFFPFYQAEGQIGTCATFHYQYQFITKFCEHGFSAQRPV